MGNLVFNMSWDEDKNPQTTPLVSSDEFKDMYLYGIPLCNPTTNVTLSDDTIQFYIRAAKKFVETNFGIKIAKQIIQETKDFLREEFYNFGFIRATYPVNKPYELTGQISRQQIITYPFSWLTSRQSNDGIRFKNIYIIPTGYGSTTFIQGYYAYQTYFNFFGQRFIPDYWQITYCTGFDIIPEDLLNLILTMAAIPLLLQLELGGVKGMGGYMFGLAGNSLSLDGMSQNITKMNGGNIFSQRIKQYWDTVNLMLPMLKSNYGGFNFEVF